MNLVGILSVRDANMNYFIKYIPVFIGLVLPLLAIGQEVRPVLTDTPADSLAADSVDNDRIKILNADMLKFEQVEGIPIQKLIGRVEIQQDSTFFFCDSAYHFESQNRLEAYSRVRIEMSDSVTLTGDRLIYFSDTKIAEVYDNITLTDQQAVLTTDRLTYLREEDYGFYNEGGKLVDDDNTLTSETGYYYTKDKDAFFKKEVMLVSPDYTLETDTLGYNTDTKIAKFLTLTKILSTDGEITTTNGNYNTDKKKINLYERSTVEDSSYVLTADSLRYEDDNNLGYAVGNVHIQEEDSTLEIRGQYGQFNRKTDESMVTEDPVAIQFMDEDTLYMFADTLMSLKIKRVKVETDSIPVDSLAAVVADTNIQTVAIRDSLMKGVDPIDSLLQIVEKVEPSGLLTPESIKPRIDSSLAVIPSDSVMMGPRDSAMAASSLALSTLTQADSVDGQRDSIDSRVFRAYRNVRLFMNDMQGRADSLIYMFDDSVIYMYQNPVLWSDESQVTGDSIIMWMKNGQIDSMWVGANAFMASKEDTVGFNQIKGKEMRAKFRDNKMYRLHVIGNTESIYFAKNEDDTTQVIYEGMNKALAQEMVMYFVDNEIQRIVFLSQPEGTFFPFFAIIFEENKLEGLSWRGDERPEKPQLFVTLPNLPFKIPVPIQQSDTSPSQNPEGNR